MLALGLNYSQVGLVATVFMLSQVVCAFLSGPITDKMGRRNATAIFDFVAWCIPCFIWWRADNFWFFFIAALINGTMQIVSNAWNCLLIEDADKKQITGIHSLVVVAVQLSSFLGPIVAVLFSRLSLVSAIRVLYINGFVVMTAKVLLCYVFSRETRMGMIRREETRGKSIFSLALGYGGVLKIIIRSRGTIFAMAITALVGIVVMINNTFWQVIVSQKLLVPVQFLPFFLVLKSAITIVFLLFVVPYMTKGLLKLPLLTGFVCYFTGQTILILAPVEGSFKYIMLCISLVFDGFGFGTLHMLARSLVALNVNVEERARVMAIVSMTVMAVTSPFGLIGGILSDISRTFPFVLNLCLLAAGFCITFIYYKKNPRLENT